MDKNLLNTESGFLSEHNCEASEYREYYSFTKPEVEALLEEHGVPAPIKDAAPLFYGGYKSFSTRTRFSKTDDVPEASYYCPRSICELIAADEFQIDGNSLPLKIQRLSLDASEFAALKTLAKRKYDYDHIVSEPMKAIILKYLLVTGHLTISDAGTVRLPNEEMRMLDVASALSNLLLDQSLDVERLEETLISLPLACSVLCRGSRNPKARNRGGACGQEETSSKDQGSKVRADIVMLSTSTGIGAVIEMKYDGAPAGTQVCSNLCCAHSSAYYKVSWRNVTPNNEVQITISAEPNAG
uniref:Uncharacterized protein n=1 Tax=Ditylenchus dipsaci TaxID=166011 RepID=A0A915E3L7_9BILA